jgi:alpha-galactosidase
MCFGLTTVAWRKGDLEERLAKSRALVSGEKQVEIKETGEEGVQQLRALFGLRELVTNVNIPNQGQIPNLPMGAVVETNAVFRANSLKPVFAGPVPKEIYPLVSRICSEQELVSEAIAERDLEKIFSAFANDPLVTCNIEDARKLFKEMCENTKAYLTMYDM